MKILNSLAVMFACASLAQAQVNNNNTDPPVYALVDLGTLGGYESIANGINSLGQVVGYALTSGDDNDHAFLWKNGVMQDLGTLGGGSSFALGINSIGQVVGISDTSNVGEQQPFLWQNGSMQDLGDFGGDEGIANGINSIGQIVGSSDTSGGSENAFLWQNGVIQDIGTPGNDSAAYGINSVGQIVGYNGNDACLWQNGITQDLGNLGGSGSLAYWINSVGQIVGSSFTSEGDTHAFLWQNGSMQDLGTLPGWSSLAYGINSTAQIVGCAFNSTNSHALLWQNGTTYDLNNLVFSQNSGWTLGEATGINDSGQICGYGINPQGLTHAFLLNPLPSGSTTAVTNVQTNLPPYGIIPAPQPGQDSLVLITHGYINPYEETVSQAVAFIGSMSNSINQYLTNSGLDNWYVYGYLWTSQANIPLHDGGPEAALINGEQQGRMIGNAIVAMGTNGWKHIHFIGHSAGAGLIQAATDVIKTSSLANDITIQCTFLDPYNGAVGLAAPDYGNHTEWSDNYFVRDGWQLGGWTGGPILHTYNVDVTGLDPAADYEVSGFVSGSDPSQPCIELGFSSHGWPIEFYTNSITGVIAGNLSMITNGQYYDGFGFPLSAEVMNLEDVASEYPPGNGAYLFGYGSVTNLGPQGENCVPQIQSQQYTGQWNSFPASSTIESAIGTIETYFNSAQLATSTSSGQNEMVQQSQSSQPQDDTLTNTGSVWLGTVVTDTNGLNYVSFDAEFTDAEGSDGLLTVYWDTNLVGEIDEAAVQPGLQSYTFTFPLTVANTSHVLGFHLDSFTSVQSSILLTNIVTGCVGVSQPPVLSITTNIVNGLQVYQLAGQPANYTIEASTNLGDTNWVDIATLGNTNGTVQFTDPDSANYPIRFYRAVSATPNSQ